MACFRALWPLCRDGRCVEDRLRRLAEGRVSGCPPECRHVLEKSEGRAREQFGAGDAQRALGTLQQALTEQPEDHAAYAFAAELPRRAEPLPSWGQVELSRTELMLDQPDRARRLPHEARQVPAAEREDYAASTQRLSDMLARFGAAARPGVARPLAEWTVREWHFVQYGAAILDYMDARAGATCTRAAATTKWRLTVHKLREFLQDVGQVPPVVWAIPERDSEVLGRALADLLGVPCVTGERPLPR